MCHSRFRDFIVGCGAAVLLCSGVLAAGAQTAPPLSETYREAAERLIGAALTSDRAYTRMSELCDGIGARLSGSPELERAVEWSAQRMRDDGLQVRLQPVMVPRWVRGHESATLVAPREQPLHMLGLGRSVGTPPEGITADVVVVSSYDELDALPDEALRGRIVLYNVPFTTYGETVRFRGSGADSASARGAVAALVRSVGPVSLQTPHTGALRYRDTAPRIPAAAISIEDAEMIQRLYDRGVPVRVNLKMEAETLADALSHNVIGELRGRERPDEVVVVGGHLDSWDVGQGAHDDAGGCVISMEAVALIRQLGLRPRRTLRVVLWTNEENGLRGGTTYRDSLGSDVERHVAAIESDGGVERPAGFGFSALLRDTTVVDPKRQERVLARARAIAPLLAGIGADRVFERGGGADIGPIMRRGVPGIAHRTVMEKYFHWHHTHADALDKVEPLELRKNVAAMAVMAYVLADMPARLDDPLPSEAVQATK